MTYTAFVNKASGEISDFIMSETFLKIGVCKALLKKRKRNTWSSQKSTKSVKPQAYGCIQLGGIRLWAALLQIKLTTGATRRATTRQPPKKEMFLYLMALSSPLLVFLMLLTHSGCRQSKSKMIVDLCALTQHLTRTVTNLGVKLDSEIKSAVKFQLATVEAFLSQHHF